MYNLAIGDRTYSSWSLRGWLLFANFDIPVHVDSARMKSTEFKEMLQAYGGGRLVPAVRIDEPTGAIIVTDTIAIAETLAERHPEKHMWPKDPAARALARSMVAEMHAGFQNIRNDCTMNLRHFYDGFTPSDAVVNELARIDEIWTTARTKWGSSGPWLFGEYTIADAFYAPLVTRIATYDLPVCDIAEEYVITTLNDPKFNEWHAAAAQEDFVQPGYDLELPKNLWFD